jgi:hypothetical protein
VDFINRITGIFNKPEGEEAAREKLSKAAEDGNLREVERITGLFPQAPKWNFSHGPAHLIAAKHGHNDVMLFMLDKGADIEAKNNSGYSALAISGWMGQEKTARLLIERGANPAGTPLIKTEHAGKSAILKMMHQADKLREEYKEAQARQKTQAAEDMAENIRQGAEEKIGLLKKIKLRLKP